MPRGLFTRRNLLSFGAASLVSASIAPFSKLGYRRYQVYQLSRKERSFDVADDRSLAERAAAKGFLYGAATQHQLLAQNPAFAAAFLKECGFLVTENDLQWKEVHPLPRQFDFSAADALVEFAASNKLLFRGHNLVWHNCLPDWYQEVVNSHNAEQILVNHVQTVVGRYAGKVHSWDVVNEAIEPKDNRSDRLRRTPWVEFLGPSYVDLAFRVAAAADPQAMLIYNDYGLEYDTPEHEAKRDAVLTLLQQLKAQGTPVHGFGMQSHLYAHITRFNPEKLRRFLADVASLGLKILVTELDVVDRDLPADITVRDRIVASAYEDYLDVVLDEPAVIAVLTWGLSDRYTWLSESQPRSDGLPVRPLPLDENMNRKLAWNAIARAFDRRPSVS